jgi:hypothetical protein
MVGPEGRGSAVDPASGTLGNLRRELDVALDEGAFAMSKGMIYPPSSYARDAELVALAEVLASFDADEGQRVTFDQYPYTAGSTMLTVLLPPWVRQGESADVLARLRDDEVRERIAADIAEPGEWENLTRAAGTWENILITRTASGRYQADTIEDVSAAMDREPVDAICELLVEEELDVTMGGLRDVREGHRAVPRRPPGNLLYGQYLRRETHPWAIGTFGRILERYVREWGVLSPERTVQKTAGAPADVLGFLDRGTSARGTSPTWSSSTSRRCRPTPPTRTPTGLPTVSSTCSSAANRPSRTGPLPALRTGASSGRSRSGVGRPVRHSRDGPNPPTCSRWECAPGLSFPSDHANHKLRNRGGSRSADTTDRTMIDARDDTDEGGPEPDSATVEDLREIVERIIELDQRRQKALREEVKSGADRFDETHEVLTAEEQELAKLETYLAAESERLSDLVEGTEHLSVEQAVRHRELSIEKIREHNEELTRFHRTMEALLATVETNVERLETEGLDAEIEDSSEHLEAAVDAIRDHNESIEGLGTNLRILQAYLT